MSARLALAFNARRAFLCRWPTILTATPRQPKTLKALLSASHIGPIQLALVRFIEQAAGTLCLLTSALPATVLSPRDCSRVQAALACRRLVRRPCHSAQEILALGCWTHVLLRHTAPKDNFAEQGGRHPYAGRRHLARVRRTAVATARLALSPDGATCERRQIVTAFSWRSESTSMPSTSRASSSPCSAATWLAWRALSS